MLLPPLAVTNTLPRRLLRLLLVTPQRTGNFTVLMGHRLISLRSIILWGRSKQSLLAKQAPSSGTAIRYARMIYILRV